MLDRITLASFRNHAASRLDGAAITEAVGHARADAETMAKAAGGTLGQLLEVTSAFEPIRPFEATMARARVAAEHVERYTDGWRR